MQETLGFQIPPINLDELKKDYQLSEQRVLREMQRIGFRHPAIIDLYLTSWQSKKDWIKEFPQDKQAVLEGLLRHTGHVQIFAHLPDAEEIANAWHLIELTEANDDSYRLLEPDGPYCEGYENLVRQVTLTDVDVEGSIEEKRQGVTRRVNTFMEDLVAGGKALEDVLEFVQLTEPQLKENFYAFLEGINSSRFQFILNTLYTLREQRSQRQQQKEQLPQTT